MTIEMKQTPAQCTRVIGDAHDIDDKFDQEDKKGERDINSLAMPKLP